MNWLLTSLYWYFFIFSLGLIFCPLTKKIFKSFYDFGYPFSKVLSIIFLSYSIFVLGIIKILPFTQINLLIILIIFFLINFKLKTKKTKSNLAIIFFEEALFLISFLFWIYIRGQEPSIRGLEKFMDFGFINSILKTKHFPPIDMWLSSTNKQLTGLPINYYYFGHLTGAVFIKLTNISSFIGYNLILATIFALAITTSFSFVFNLCFLFLKENQLKDFKKYFLRIIFVSLLGSFIVNLGGNLHTIYVFTKGYPNEQPIPFWKIFSLCNTLTPHICQKIGETLNSYWYPNATRFIPYTIHEFPSYSYVVADLHGHVFDIPFVILTITVLFLFFISKNKSETTIKNKKNHHQNLKNKNLIYLLINKLSLIQLITPIFLGFLTAVHYMTNAFDGPIYFLLSLIIFLIKYGLSFNFGYSLITMVSFFLIFSLPFSINFKPFVSGIGVNCAPDFLTKISKLGPFIFEANNCQISPFWMLFLLWGFFWLSFIILLLIFLKKENNNFTQQLPLIVQFVFILFSFGTFLIIIPEFFYIKDIYPVHFRANTMFKLGYQSFIMMGLSSAFTYFLIKLFKKKIFFIFYFLFFILIFIYPFYAVPSYYGKLKQKPVLDGSLWLNQLYPETKEIIDWLNQNVKDQPVILEAQGDSYTDFNVVSSYTGLPTVAGWWVHQWLWRGSADVVGKRIPDIVSIYENNDLNLTKKLIKKYQIKYIIVSKLEKQKYSNLNEEKILKIGKIVFKSSNNLGAIYQVK